jgi:dTDP-4-dehydrorhamnose reductase
MRQRVLVTGAAGQLGSDILKVLDGHYEVIGTTREHMDITNGQQTSEFIASYRPDIIIHSAAYTKVDLAESEPDEAFRINAYGTRNVAVASEKVCAKLVYVSTDYVFDGMGQTPLHEFSLTSPINVYGLSKLAGEEFVKTLCSRFFIVRTSWVYGSMGNNFVKTMLRLSQEMELIQVVHDQVGCPTFTMDLAECIRGLMLSDAYGVYHVSNSGYCSWYEFAQEIFRLAGKDVKTVPITSEEFVRPAKRPQYSVLDHMSLRLSGFPAMRHWKEGLQDFIRLIEG